MISLKEYAKKKNVSYEAVRKQVNRYRTELGSHLQKIDRTQYLDEEGEAFLDEKRASSPVIIIERDKDFQIEELNRQNEALKLKIMTLQDQLIKSKDQIIECNQQLLELKDQVYLLTIKEESDMDGDADKTEELLPEDLPEAFIQPDVQPLYEQESEKKWWQFWK